MENGRARGGTPIRHQNDHHGGALRGACQEEHLPLTHSVPILGTRARLGSLLFAWSFATMLKRKTAPSSPTASNLGQTKYDKIDDVEGGYENNGSNGSFLFSHGLTSDECIYLLRIHGKNELPEKVVSPWYILMNLLLEPMPIMIWLAIIIEAVLGKWTDMTILLGIQLTNASIAFYGMNTPTSSPFPLTNSHHTHSINVCCTQL